MTLWAIVPVKPLRRGKSRLAGTLSEDERTDLNRKLLQHTLKTLCDLKELEEVLVISRDPQALTVARNCGARTVREAAKLAGVDVERIALLASVQPRGFIPPAIAEYLGLRPETAVTTYRTKAHLGGSGPVANFEEGRRRGSPHGPPGLPHRQSDLRNAAPRRAVRRGDAHTGSAGALRAG